MAPGGGSAYDDVETAPERRLDAHAPGEPAITSTGDPGDSSAALHGRDTRQVSVIRWQSRDLAMTVRSGR